MGLSEFQRKKAINLFQDIYDVNKDGVLEKADFDQALDKVVKVHNWGQDDSAFKDAQATLAKVWESLRKMADGDGNGTIDLDEWCAMWGSCIDDVTSGRGFPAWQRDYMDFMFYANDTSGDGFIDKDEYAQVFKQFGFSDCDVTACFAKISQGCADAKLSKEDFQRLSQEYFTAEDEGAQGNFLFCRQKH